LRLAEGGARVPSPGSGYLQYVRHQGLIRLAIEKGAVIQLHRRPGQFLIEGNPIATVWPASTADEVAKALDEAHICGPTRTLAQDLSFAVDQLVEIAIRALSPAVNDTFTALTCIDWLGDGLCKITTRWQPIRVHRDSHGYVRVITAEVRYSSLVERAFEKIRQSSRGMPAVMIRQLDALAKIMVHTESSEQRELLLHQAEMIRRSCAETVPEPSDVADVDRAYQLVLAAGEAGA
jgi:uncharacterized membrane protein